MGNCVPIRAPNAVARLRQGALDAEDGWISFASHCQLLESAAFAAGDEVYGARLGLSVDPLLFLIAKACFSEVRLI